MKVKDILEARKHSILNPKISINQHIKDYLEKAGTLPNSTIKNAFISFTNIEKLGINPQTSYNTPVGIYAYPLEYVYNIMKDGKSAYFLPFAGTSPYANLFSVSGNIIDLPSISEEQVSHYYKVIEERIIYSWITQYLAQMKEIDYEISIEDVDTSFLVEYINELKQKVFKTALRSKLPGGRFWAFCYAVQHIPYLPTPKSIPSALTVLFTKHLGIDGFIDNTGIIHHNEPIQALFFKTSIIKNRKLVDNKYSPIQPTKAQLAHDEEESNWGSY